MQDITLVILCAGESSRFALHSKKQWLRIGDEPLWLNVANRLTSYSNFKDTIIVGHAQELSYMKNFSDEYTYIQGGNSRQESMCNALKEVTTPYIMISDVARSCIPQEVIQNLIDNKLQAPCIVPALKISDTITYQGDTIDRDGVRLIQTPQLSKTEVLKKALETSTEFTDDSSAIKELGESIHYIEGSLESSKLTFGEDIIKLNCLKPPSKDQFTGFGIDIHSFEEGKEMFLGGIKVDSSFGFKAHSDGDVLIHSIIDALLGASGAGDIGEFFPDTDRAYKGADSKELLQYIVKFINNVGFEIVNVDFTILAEAPKINPIKNSIKSSLSALLQIPKYKINIKATTSEKMGFVGRKEGVSIYSVATLKYYNWTKS